MKKAVSLFIAVALSGSVAVFNSCKPGNAETAKVKALDTTLLDRSINPADDFFMFVNSKWIKANPIPSDKSSWGAFHELDELSKKATLKVMEEAAKNKDAAKGSNTQLLGAYYRTAMDTAFIEKQGISPLKNWLGEVDKFGTPTSNAELMAKLTNTGFFGMYVDIDAKNSSQYALYLVQGGLGLPDRDYYFRTDAKSVETRAKYKEHIAKVFELGGDNAADAKKKADVVFGIEEKLAKASMTLIERRNPYATYNLSTIADWNTKNKNFDWATFFKLSGIPATQTQVVVSQPAFFTALDGMLKTVPAADWKTYLRYSIINDNSEYLSSNFVNEHFSFYDKFLKGKETLEPRWKRTIGIADYLLRDIVGQEYVKTNFSDNAKKRADELVKNVRGALATRIDGLTWMSAETKVKAKDKLSKIITKIGYPDKWLTYDGLEMTDRHWWFNLQAGFAYEQKRNLSKLGKAVDKTEWLMGPQEVNAYYNPTVNEIVFPAAILQPPFFNEFADDAMNYGGIGMVIGHELTHGFDDEGRQFDASGNLTPWWTSQDSTNYAALTDVFVKQYNSYTVVDTVHVQGMLTLGENIADLGGMTIAYEAFKKANKTTEKIDGFTPNQRFFISLAQIWRGHYRPEALRNMVYTNPHSPPMFRVNGVVCNMPEFYEAFGVKPGNKLYLPEDKRAKLW